MMNKTPCIICGDDAFADDLPMCVGCAETVVMADDVFPPETHATIKLIAQKIWDIIYPDTGDEDGGYPDDYEAQYGADGYDMARADGCEPCGIGADELEFVRSGFMGRDYAIVCPYCGDVITGGTFSLWDKVRDVWVVMVDGWRVGINRLMWFVRRSKSSDADNMSDIPF